MRPHHSGPTFWGVWDRANGRWVGDTTSSYSDAKFNADRWNAVYSTIYYVVRQVGFETKVST
jgi:hypothetical protein